MMEKEKSSVGQRILSRASEESKDVEVLSENLKAGR